MSDLRERVARAIANAGIQDRGCIGMADAAIAVALEEAANIVDRNAEACTGNIMLRDILAGNAAAIRALTEKEETP